MNLTLIRPGHSPIILNTKRIKSITAQKDIIVVTYDTGLIITGSQIILSKQTTKET